MTASTQVCKFGNATILVNDGEFDDGYSNGYLSYTRQDAPFSVEAIRRMIVESITDTGHPQNWNTGYIAGAIRGIYEGCYAQQDEPDAPHVQLGPLILRLNRWRFRDGYYNGQQHYQ